MNATGEASATTPVSVRVSERASYLINCGSVGQPRDGDPRSCHVLFDTAKESVVFQRVAYPHESTRKKIIASHLQPQLALRLAEGT
jgi:diadenosine tetraphosphatase ApaH/serine/threonine PP2A family protein phosphatase